MLKDFTPPKEEDKSNLKAEIKALREKLLAQQHPVDADFVCGVPDCGIESAIGYSMESGIRYATGLIKNKYLGRAFRNRKSHHAESCFSAALRYSR